MKAADVRKQVQSGETAPLYLLEGDDLHSRHDLALEFAALVDEGLQAFNVQIFHANEAGTAGARDQMMGEILAAARTLPMMAPRRVLLVHEAERLLSPKKARDEEADAPAPAASDKKRRKTLTPGEELEEYFERPEPMTTAVFVAGALDANRRLVKALRKHAVVVDCGTLDSAAEAGRWIQKRLEQDQLTIDAKAVSLLLESTGLSLGRIRAETEKLALYAAGEKNVTPAHVRDVISPAAETSEEFALARAIGFNDARRALREIAAQLDGGKPPFMVLGLIRYAAGRLQPDERSRRALDAVLETDLAIKSSMGEPQYLLERLVIDLCARR